MDSALPLEKVRGKTILIIDDDEDHVELLENLVSLFEGKTFSAYSGKEGCDLIKNQPAEFLFLDIFLEDMTGWDVFHQMRDRLEKQNISVLFFTSQLNETAQETFDQIKDYPRSKLLSKRCTTSKLIHIMDEMLTIKN